MKLNDITKLIIPVHASDVYMQGHMHTYTYRHNIPTKPIKIDKSSRIDK